MVNPFTIFGQEEYTYTLSDPDVMTATNDTAALGGLMVIYVVLFLIFGIPTIIGMWKTFQKAGQPGWAALVPIYNMYIWLKIVGRPTWWMAFLLVGFIPFVGAVVTLVISIILSNDMAKSFAKGVGYTVLLVLLPFIGFPMLGFGDAKYVGPAAANGGTDGANGNTPTSPSGSSATPPSTPSL